MKQYTTNRFYKGVNTDLSYLERQADVLLDALNVRLTSTDTDGFFAVNIKGNVEEFDLGINNVPIGTVEYNGVLYILSVNKVTKEGQIGSFPSPKLNGLGGFDRVYRPLQNYTLDNPNVYVDPCEGDEVPVINRQDFITEKLNFNCEHQARVLARVTFDQSVNLYWTDNYNPLRSINVGFNNETGAYNNKYVSEYMLDTDKINIISESNFIPIMTLDKLETDGSFLAGHYFFFVRYIDIEFNTSSFIGCSKPVPIFLEKNQTNLYTPTGFTPPTGFNINGPMPYGGQEDTVTNRSITFNISNLDPAAGFVEFAYIYFKSKTEYDIKLIDKRYSINDLINSGTVKFLGNETQFTITIDELVTFKPTDSQYCKDIAQIDNKLYIANTRGISLDHPDLRKFFCKIKILEDNTLQKSVEVQRDSSIFPGKEFITTHASNNPYGIDEKEVHQEVGYFSGESYCFAAVPVFKGGFTGQAFPIKGSDNLKGLLANENFNGVFRFSDAETNSFQTAGTPDRVTIKGVKFDITNAQAFYNTSNFLKENLIGIYFCRSERVKNLLYQGLAVPLYTGGEVGDAAIREFKSKSIAGIYATEDQYYDYFKVAPLIENAVPYIYNFWKTFGTDEFAATSYQRFTVNNYWNTPPGGESGYISKTRESLGIFSFDQFIDDGTESSEILNNAYIKKVGRINDNNWIPRPPYRDAGSTPTIDTSWRSVSYPDEVDATANVPHGKIKLFYSSGMDALSETDYQGGGFTADTYSVPSWDAIGINIRGRNHPTKITEGQVGDGLFWKEIDRASTEKDEVCMNLPFATPSYILVDLLSSNPDNQDIDKWWNCIVNVYKENPESATYNYESMYDFKNQFFSQISDFLPLEQSSSNTNFNKIQNKIFYQGDCFATRSFLKILNKFDDSLGEQVLDVIATGESVTEYIDSVGNPITSFSPQNPKHFFAVAGYDVGISVITENKYNPNYRYSKGRNLFYPIENDFLNPAKNTVNSPEANFYNKGYERMLTPRTFLGIDRFLPSSDNYFPTRIRPSFKHILNSLKDGYLQFTPGDYKDFDFQYGPINALMAYNDQLFSFQDDAINLHPINERAVAQSTGTDTPFILGESRELTEFKRALSVKYGTQHQWSVVKGEAGIYGFDWNKNVFWRVTGQGFQDLGLVKSCQKWIYDIVESEGKTFSDITEQLSDNPVCAQGIHSTYDRKYKEVIVTFIFGEDKNQTISFSEKGDFFGAKYSFTPTMYSELENDLYSFSGGKFWRHNVNTEYDNFYGVQDPAFIEVVVNPNGEIAKHFDNIAISSNNVEFDEISYRTQHQNALQNPFLGEFWNRAVYREFQWKLPIRRADAIQDSNLSLGVVQSRMRGRYLIINLKYADNKYMWVREIITAYTQSKA